MLDLLNGTVGEVVVTIVNGVALPPADEPEVSTPPNDEEE
tara:strand:- start:183 stop:302 length:120 start_codon:yes stop_codon:yes gene_type:complete